MKTWRYTSIIFNLLLDGIALLASRFGRSDLLGEAPAACWIRGCVGPI
jgi:hypothetical protein